jgi:hypothetical protein
MQSRPKLIKTTVHEGSKTLCRFAKNSTKLLSEDKDDIQSQNVPNSMLNWANTPGKLVIPNMKCGVDRPWTENIKPIERKAKDKKLTLIFRMRFPAIPMAIDRTLARMDTRLTI